MKLTQVIYADVLFIINTYITYALIWLTGLIAKHSTSRLRVVLSALLGGAYSFIIIIPGISDTVIGLSRIPAAVIFILISFGFRGKRQFLRLFCSFFLVNFIFAGLMFALWYFASPTSMYFSSSVVYLDIEPLTLIVLTAVCYVIVRIIDYFVRIRSPKNTVYDLKIHIGEKTYPMRAFYDTGNSLRDPFTGSDVIIVSRDALKDIFPPEKTWTDIMCTGEIRLRYLPCRTVSGAELLPVFKADRAQIKGISVNISLSDVIIAVSDEKIKNGDFAALLPKGIFDNSTSEKGADYDEDNKKIFTPVSR